MTDTVNPDKTEDVVDHKKEEEVLAELDSFAELPDAPPKRKFRLSWVGYLATGIVAFWLIICLIGPSIAPALPPAEMTPNNRRL